MAITNKGKDAILNAMLTGAKMALGNMSPDGKSFTEISKDQSINPAYARMSITPIDHTPNDPGTKILYVSIKDGVVTNLNTAFYADADDGQTKDSLIPLEEGGWQEGVSAIGIYNTVRGVDTLYYAAQFRDTPAKIYQGHRVKIGKGNLRITFTPTESEA